MPALTFRRFLFGPDADRVPSRWHPALAVLAAFLVVLIGQGVPVAAIAAIFAKDWIASLFGVPYPAGPSSIRIGTIFEEHGILLLVLSQAALAAATLWLGSRYRCRATEALGLLPPEGGARAFAYAFAVFVPMLIVFNVVTFVFAYDSFMSDFRAFLGVVRGREPLLAFTAIGIGAPVWEEMLFRGFLLPPLTAGITAWIATDVTGWQAMKRPWRALVTWIHDLVSRLAPSHADRVPFWTAAAIVSAGWSVLHFTYTSVGLFEVFLIGLFFAWLVKRTGSLLVPLVCHAVYNSSIFLALRLLPL